MNLTVILAEGQALLFQLIIFGGLGYLNGWLAQEIGFIKIIALIILLPASLEFLISVNQVYVATVPFLIFAWFGFYGFKKTYQNIKEMYRVFR